MNYMRTAQIKRTGLSGKLARQASAREPGAQKVCPINRFLRKGGPDEDLPSTAQRLFDLAQGLSYLFPVRVFKDWLLRAKSQGGSDA
jgi:hypothetical protein